jgi:outer membrane protein
MNAKILMGDTPRGTILLVCVLFVAIGAGLCLYATPSFAQTGTTEQPTQAPPRDVKIVQNFTRNEAQRYTIQETLEYALKNNPKVRISAKDIEIETYGIDAAQAERMPRIDFGSGASRYRYPMPLTPPVISGPFGAGLDIPDYSRNVYDAGGSLRLPVFKGGRLYRAVVVAELKKAIAEDNYVTSKQDLVFNLTSVFYKIAELEKLLIATDGNVKQLEAHKRDVELLYKTGAVAYLDLLKTDVQLAYAIEQRLAVKNNLDSAYELLKTLMGIDDMERRIEIVYHESAPLALPSVEESLSRAFEQRPEYRAIGKKKKIFEERVKIAQGKRLPDVYVAGEYGGKAGDSLAFKENWFFGARLSIPVFDGGLIAAEVNKERTELQKVVEEERSLKLTITREVRDAHLNIATAREKTEVAKKTIDSAKENVRIERLKYQTGAGTNTDYLDAQTDLLRTEADYFRAYFDEEVARAALRKAIGEETTVGSAK